MRQLEAVGYQTAYRVVCTSPPIFARVAGEIWPANGRYPSPMAGNRTQPTLATI